LPLLVHHSFCQADQCLLQALRGLAFACFANGLLRQTSTFADQGVSGEAVLASIGLRDHQGNELALSGRQTPFGESIRKKKLNSH
jgi:hypothetical protein